MSMLPMTTIQEDKPNRIGGIIPEGKLTLLTGLAGTGKSFSLLKFLNKKMIQPILFNMCQDFDLEQFYLSASSCDQDELTRLVSNRYTNIKNSVIVLDDYDHCKSVLSIDSLKKQEKFARQLEVLCSTQYCTLIVVADGKLDPDGSTGVFKDNLPLVRTSYEHLHINTEMDMFMNKGRGVGGFKGFPNWMRK